MGKLALRMETNASRFEQYVDAIILLIGIIRTWQAIIDLSVNWQKKCSSCTNDNYNFYGCGFSFICEFVQFPVLPIPEFRIPSIYLDFSHIDASISLRLPEFQFVPTAIPLPSLPELPNPPAIIANFDVNTQKDLALALVQKLAKTFGGTIGAEIAKMFSRALE